MVMVTEPSRRGGARLPARRTRTLAHDWQSGVHPTPADPARTTRCTRPATRPGTCSTRGRNRCLTIFSDQDAVAPDGWKPIVARIPGAQDQPHVILEGGGHFLQEDIGEAYTDALMAWLGVGIVTRDPKLASHPRLGNPEWVDNWTVGSGLRMEFIDGLGQVWLCQEPVTSGDGHGTLASRRRLARAARRRRRRCRVLQPITRRRPSTALSTRWRSTGCGSRSCARPLATNARERHGAVDRQAPHDALRRRARRSTCSTSATAASPRPHGARRSTKSPRAGSNARPAERWALRTAELTAISSRRSPTRPRSSSSTTGRASTVPSPSHN